jgi:hypothetical protein
MLSGEIHRWQVSHDYWPPQTLIRVLRARKTLRNCRSVRKSAFEQGMSRIMDEVDDSVPESTLLPRFTIRALLNLVTICAVAFLIAGMAYRGQVWAWGVTIGLISLVFTMVVHAAWFGAVQLFAKVSPPPKEVP